MTDQQRIDIYFLSRILWWRHELDSLDDATIAQVHEALRSVQSEITAELNAHIAGLSRVTEWQEERLQQIDAWLDEILLPAQATLTSAVLASATTAATASVLTYNAMLSFDGTARATKTLWLTPDQIEQFFIHDPLGGKLLGDWVSQTFDDGVKASLRAALQSSVVRGEGTQAAIGRLLQQAVVAGFALTERQADVLARTYIQSGNAGAMQAVYERNRRIVKGVRWSIALDNHVCHLCSPLDGMRWRMDEQKPPFPRHWKCRCSLLPVVKPEDLDITPDDLHNVTRPWTLRDPGRLGTTKAKIYEAGTSDEYFRNWWKSLAYDEQIKSIGPIRAQMLRDGRLSWGDLVDRHTGEYKKLNELGFLQSGERMS